MKPWPRSLLGQLALLVLGAFLAAQALSLWIFADERGAAIRAAQRLATAERAAAVALALERSPQEARGDILAAVESRHVRFAVGDAPLAAGGPAPALLRARIETALGPRDVRIEEVSLSPHGGRPADPPEAVSWLHARMRAAGVAPVEMRLSIPLEGGDWLNVASRFQRPALQLPPARLATTLLSLALLGTALWLGLRRITGPLRRLAEAADGVGLDGPPQPMPAGGPREVRALADALGRMQARLSGLVTERTRMLAALGHDLRSPITALRVRAEMVDDDDTRERMAAMLDEMQEMVEATLAYARGVSPDQPAEPVDLAALLTDLAADLSETGAPVTVTAPEPAVAQARRTALRRALRNLIENAQRHGGAARVVLDAPNGSDDMARIRIDDDGPGIPDGDLERVFDPFVRLESSRSRETGGTGLGLPIARAILRAHNGDVHLANRPGGGLATTVALPATGNHPRPSN